MFNWQDAWEHPYTDVALTGNHLSVVYWSKFATQIQPERLSAIIEDSRSNNDRAYGQPPGFHASFERAVLAYAEKQARRKPMGLTPDRAVHETRLKIVTVYDRFDPLKLPLPHNLAVMRQSVPTLVAPIMGPDNVYAPQLLRYEILFFLQYRVIGANIQPHWENINPRHPDYAQLASLFLEQLDPDRDQVISWLTGRCRANRTTVANVVTQHLTNESLAQLIEDWKRLEQRFKSWIKLVVYHAILDAWEADNDNNGNIVEIDENVPAPIASADIPEEMVMLLPVLMPYIGKEQTTSEKRMRFLVIVALRKEGWNYPEIADCLNVSENVARSIYNWGIQWIGELLEKIRGALQADCVSDPGWGDFIGLLDELDSTQNLYQWHIKKEFPTSWAKYVNQYTKIFGNDEFQCNTWLQDLNMFYTNAIRDILPWPLLLKNATGKFCEGLK